MNGRRRLRIVLGLFVVFAAVLLATLIVMFGSAPTLFKRTTTYTIRFTDAPGISSGSPVRRSGVRIGTVRDVILDDERGVVRVRVAIDPPHVIRNNEQPTLVIGLLGSDASIDFIPKVPEDGEPVDRSVVPPGSELVGVRAANVNTLLARATEVVPTTQETLNDMRKSMQRLEKLAARIEKSVPIAEDTMREYQKLAKDTRAAVPEVRKTNAEIGELARSLRQTVPELQRTNEEVRELARTTRQAVPDVQKASRDVGELAREMRKSLPSFEKTSQDVGNLARDARKVLPEYERAAREFGDFTKEARKTLPEIEKTSREFGDLARDARKSLPEYEKASREVAGLARDLRQALPEVQRTNEEIRELARAAREAVPELRKNADDVGAAARNWGKLGERLDLLVQTNEDKIVKAIENLAEASGRVNRLLNDDNLRNIQSTITNMKAASDSAPSIARNADELFKEGKTTARNLNASLAQVDELVKDLRKLTGPAGQSGDRIMRNLDQSLEKLNGLLGDGRALMRAIDQSNGTFRRLLTDPSLYNNIDAAAAMLPRLMPRIERILKDFEVFSDKLARHPETIGVRGALRPSTGLKSPPTPPLAPTGVGPTTIQPPVAPVQGPVMFQPARGPGH